jgi:hypothetical protein
MILAIANIPRQVKVGKYRFAFISSTVTIALLLIMVALEVFPSTSREQHHRVQCSFLRADYAYPAGDGIGRHPAGGDLHILCLLDLQRKSQAG